MSWIRFELPDRGCLFVISGPSGAGKSTLIHGLLAELPFLEFSVSATTRVQRPGEVDGVHYQFLDEEEFARRLTAGAFVEHAHVYGRRYGTLRAPIEAALEHGRSMVLDIDVQGARQVREMMPEAVHIFILPPDRETVLRRLLERGTEDEATVARRMREMEEQVAEIGAYDYLVVNDDLATAKALLQGIALAELSRRDRRGSLVRRWIGG